MTEMTTLAQLRHLYQNMVNGAVRDTASAKRIAEGLLAPAIEALERGTPQAVAGEPVAWQSRTRPTWGNNTAPWTQWEPCTKGQAEDYWKTNLLHDWAFEARALYTTPQPTQAQAGAVPLTDEQIEREWQFLHDEEGNHPDHSDFARAIESAHGIGIKKGDSHG